ncbi:MAG: WYL domain-containing protein, partial [Ruminococcus sp.]|nr:WYL domain-containing protein [Ruminococcus sp.]
QREKRNGILEKISYNRFRLTIKTFDSTELIPWIRTFTGRIISINSDNPKVISRFYSDICHMKNIMYKGDNNGNIQ